MLVDEQLSGRERIELLGSEKWRYMLLDVKELGYETRQKMKTVIKILDVCQIVSRRNAMFKKLELGSTLDASIMYTAMNAILEGRAFDQQELECYFLFLREYENFRHASIDFLPGIDESWIDPDLDLLILGYDEEEIKRVWNSNGELQGESYCDLQDAMVKSTITIKDFIEQGQKLVQGILYPKKSKAA
ncbi:hypothetical protein RM545_06495 [Zunongwangia sp. F260]|uniref:Uncharacterized protein n=1 Tax=Autumnicola lenta TaxID=3075593 RepID=A0ABU3CJ14_9FLAO|nr:hypothetical protein [Zunongwangia sp. F260]MDT0646334.1 hypothetical protein [Zunongwangia sp. F260]